MSVCYVIPKVWSVICWQFAFFTIFSELYLAISTAAGFAACRTGDDAAAAMCEFQQAAICCLDWLISCAVCI